MIIKSKMFDLKRAKVFGKERYIYIIVMEIRRGSGDRAKRYERESTGDMRQMTQRYIKFRIN